MFRFIVNWFSFVWSVFFSNSSSSSNIELIYFNAMFTIEIDGTEWNIYLDEFYIIDINEIDQIEIIIMNFKRERNHAQHIYIHSTSIDQYFSKKNLFV